MSEIGATVLSTVISTVIASVIAIVVSRSQNRTSSQQSIEENVTKMLDLTIAYPVLESEELCKKWPDSKIEEHDKIRYDSYCCLIFNTMERAWEHCNGGRQGLRTMLHVDELILRHQRWWVCESENRKGYIIGYRDFVDSVIAKANKREEFQ